jgi:hypothetical protein
MAGSTGPHTRSQARGKCSSRSHPGSQAHRLLVHCSGHAQVAVQATNQLIVASGGPGQARPHLDNQSRLTGSAAQCSRLPYIPSTQLGIWSEKTTAGS